MKFRKAKDILKIRQKNRAMQTNITKIMMDRRGVGINNLLQDQHSEENDKSGYGFQENNER